MVQYYLLAALNVGVAVIVIIGAFALYPSTFYLLPCICCVLPIFSILL